MKEIINLIKKANKIALFTHINPDSDALGSVGALSNLLFEMNKKCDIFLVQNPTWKFDFLQLKNIKFEFVGDYDLFIALDVSDMNRFGIFEENFKTQNNTVCIDHHAVRNAVAKNEFVNSTSSSTCEILFDLIKESGHKISPLTASCLYCGIIGDTGGFMFSNTTSKTHLIASELINCGADFYNINQNLFSSHTKIELELMQKVISRMEIKDNVVMSYILTKDIKGSDDVLHSGELINIIRSIKGVEVAILIKQVKGRNFSISLRSNNYFDVASFAGRFGGGGHVRASGMSLVGSLSQVKKILFEELQKVGKTN